MQLDYNLTVFFLLLPFVSFLYSSVGHGGASGYLALMALFSFPSELMKQTALVLNLFVAGITFYQYYRGGHFNKNLFIYFALGSIPTSYLGGLWSIDPVLYKKILGFLLIFAIARILFSINKNADELKLIRPVIALLIGATIGFFSGLIGIGGGIILSPVILLLHWGKMKETAAVSALFIWVNSFSGLLGQWTSGLNLSSTSVFMIVLALLGGALGSYVGSSKWNNKRLEYLLALVLTTAAIKLILF